MRPRPSAKAMPINADLAGRAPVIVIVHLVWASLGLAMWWTLIGA
jgi:hypothetical protein